MKTLVVYSSQSGNTRKLADAVFEAIDAEKEIYPVDEAPDPSGYNPVAVGFWFKAGKPDPLSLEFLSKIKANSFFSLPLTARRQDRPMRKAPCPMPEAWYPKRRYSALSVVRARSIQKYWKEYLKNRNHRFGSKMHPTQWVTRTAMTYRN